MAHSRWNSVGAAAPLWGTGVVLVLIGLALIGAGVRSVRHG